MFAGHAALALLAKAARPRISIAVLLPVAFAPDIIEWVFAFLGHQDRELSHSLVSVGIGATVIALIYFLATRRTADAIVVWLTYVSHWAADFITGTKPTWPGGPDVGLQLYEHPKGDALIECGIVVICWIVYRRSTTRTATPVVSRANPAVVVPVVLIAAQLVFDYVEYRLMS